MNNKSPEMLKDLEKSSYDAFNIRQSAFEQKTEIDSGISKGSTFLLSTLSVSLVLGLLAFSCKHLPHFSGSENKSATVCRNIDYPPGKETHSLISNVPTPTLTGACGSAYLTSVDTSHLTFSHHVIDKNKPIPGPDGPYGSDGPDGPEVVEAKEDDDSVYMKIHYPLDTGFEIVLNDEVWAKPVVKLNLVKSQLGVFPHITLNGQRILLSEKIPAEFKVISVDDTQHVKADIGFINIEDKQSLFDVQTYDITMDDADKIVNFMHYMDLGTKNKYQRPERSVPFPTNIQTSEIYIGNPYPETVEDTAIHPNVSSEHINNIEHILSNKLGRYNAWKTMSLKIPNILYWYSIDKDANIHKMIIDQEVRPIISATAIKLKGEQVVAHIVWLENSNNSIIPDIIVHESLIVMPRGDFSHIQQHINHINATTKITSDDDKDATGIWNRMSDAEIKSIVNKAFQ